MKDKISGVDSENEEVPIRHRKEFELYYALGEMRKLTQVARSLFGECHPDIPESHPEYTKKFASFYVKIKRWAAEERWHELAKAKTIRELRRAREDEVSNTDLSATITWYRSIIKELLSVFAYRVDLSVKLKNAVEQGHAEEIKKLRRKIEAIGEVKIDDFQEAEAALRLMQRLRKELPEALPRE